MKKNYFKLLALLLFSFSMEANAQCTGCTTTISGADATNYIVASGQTFCITSTGNMSGLITVNAGGTVCNEGIISSPYFWVNGGVLNNYGAVNVSNLLVSSAGDYNNYGSGIATLDSILITDASSNLFNNGTITTIRLGNSTGAVITNDGNIFADYVGDSVATFNNNVFLKINFDFYNAYNSTFTNAGYMDVDRDFLNSLGATFTTTCMVAVGRDWYNTTGAFVYGPALTSCGGFNVVGGTYNLGTLGNSSTHIDICDAGSPPLGLDGPSGTIATTTTYCSCVNACIVVGISEPIAHSSVLIQNIYPNPTSSSLTIELQNKQSEELLVEVMDMVGRKQSSVTINSKIGLTSTSVDVSKLAQGTYILSITDSKKLQSKQLFSVVK